MSPKSVSEKDGTIFQNPELYLSITMSDSEFMRFSKLVQDLCGIRMPEVKKTMLEARLRKRMRALSIRSFKDYWNYIDSAKGRKEELVHMIDAVTTNKTDFFREPAHLEYMYNTVLPELQEQQGPNARLNLKVWSAGCSTGKEAYSLAMIMTEYSRNVKELDFSILGTDISTDALEKASKGIYNEDKAESIPEPYRKKYLLKSKDRSRRLIRVSPEIRSLVTFGRLNFLEDDYGLQSPFNIIFCRNVIIYFEREVQQRILTKVCRYLVEGGYLFTGHSETLHGMDLPIKPMAPSVYRKQG
jgi:chemotaxis protein methyltransferase CheR